MESYRAKQKALVARLNQQCETGTYAAEIAESVRDYDSDFRVFLAIIAVPPQPVIDAAKSITDKLRVLNSSQFFVPQHALHCTIKNIRTICSPPNFSADDVLRVHHALMAIAHECPSFTLECSDFLRTPTSISIAAYSSDHFRECVLRLDDALSACGVPDNKKYLSSDVFFSNLTLVRFRGPPSQALVDGLKDIDTNELPTWRVQELSLVSATLAFNTAHTMCHGTYYIGERLRSE